MSTHVNMHFHKSDSIMRLSSDVYELGDGRKYATVKVGQGVDDMTLFFENIDDLDRLAFEFETLARVAREAGFEK